MAPVSPVQPDTLITVKISFDDESKGSKKLKVPYGVLTEGLHAFEKKVRFDASCLPVTSF